MTCFEHTLFPQLPVVAVVIAVLGAGCGATPPRPTPEGAQAHALLGSGEDGRSFEVASRSFHLTAGADVEFPDGRDTAESELGDGPWAIERAEASDVTGDGVDDAVFRLSRGAGDSGSASALLVVDAANGRVQGVITARELRIPDPARPERMHEVRRSSCASEVPALPWTSAFRLACCSCSRVCDWDELDPDETRDCHLHSVSHDYAFTPPGARVPLAAADDPSDAPSCSCD